MTLTIIFKVT